MQGPQTRTQTAAHANTKHAQPITAPLIALQDTIYATATTTTTHSRARLLAN
jgi:hypothetical protein